MSKKWNIIYYETADGKCPVDEFINTRSINNQAKIFNWLTQLETHGPNLPRPYADLLTDGIHELRIKLSGDQIRIIYFFCFRDFIILTHAFTKSTNRVPEVEIRKAVKFREDFIKRHDEKTLRSK